MDGDTIVVKDTAEANRLHNKSLAGTPETGNTLRLHLVEAIDCMERGWLAIPGMTATNLLQHGAKTGAQTEVDHLCYRDLRERGLTVRLHDGMTVWARGKTTKDVPWFTTIAHSERTPVEVENLQAGTVSIVDEDGTVTHYEVNNAVLHGDWKPAELPRMEGILLDDRVLVERAAALADSAIGTPHGDGRILSLAEAEMLRQSGALTIDELGAHARERHPGFDATLAVMQALAPAGVLTKSGFRFGTHLRAYADHPDKVHAEWLIHCVNPGDALQWSDLSRGVRLAHGVRKKFVVAIAAEPVRFIELAWFRP